MVDPDSESIPDSEEAGLAAIVRKYRRAVAGRPADPKLAEGLGLALLRAGEVTDGLRELERAVSLGAEDPTILHNLALGYGQFGDLDKARKYGEISLRRQDAKAKNLFPKHNFPPPQATGLDVVSYTLFGTGEVYLKGAIKNAKCGPDIYPGWEQRFYCNADVPNDVIAELRGLGATVFELPVPKDAHDALFWRFLVSDDPAVRRYVIRDCDSIVNVREAMAVEEWIASRRRFHVMRDSYAHGVTMMAGMWGGMAGALPPLSEMLLHFSYNPRTQMRNRDQIFLGTIVWPMIKSDCMVHDSLFTLFGARDFPPGSELPPGRHVGDYDYKFS